MVKVGAQTNGLEDKKIDDAQGHTSKRWHRLYVLRKGGSGLARIEGSRVALIRGLENYIKKSKERLIVEASNSSKIIRTKRTTTKLGNRNEKKNNCMDISSDKLTKSHTRRPAYGNKRETL